MFLYLTDMASNSPSVIKMVEGDENSRIFNEIYSQPIFGSVNNGILFKVLKNTLDIGCDLNSFLPIIRESFVGNEYRSIVFSYKNFRNLMLTAIINESEQQFGDISICHKITNGNKVYSLSQQHGLFLHRISFDEKHWKKLIKIAKIFHHCMLHFIVNPKYPTNGILLRLICVLMEKYMIESEAFPDGLDDFFEKIYPAQSDFFTPQIRRVLAYIIQQDKIFSVLRMRVLQLSKIFNKNLVSPNGMKWVTLNAGNAFEEICDDDLYKAIKYLMM